MPDKATDETEVEIEPVAPAEPLLPRTTGVIDPNAVFDAVAVEMASESPEPEQSPEPEPKAAKAEDRPKAVKGAKARPKTEAKPKARTKVIEAVEPEAPVAQSPEDEEGPAPLPKAQKGHTYVQYIGFADAISHGDIKFRPGGPWVEVPNDVAEELLTFPNEEFKAMETEGGDA